MGTNPITRSLGDCVITQEEKEEEKKTNTNTKGSHGHQTTHSLIGKFCLVCLCVIHKVKKGKDKDKDIDKKVQRAPTHSLTLWEILSLEDLFLSTMIGSQSPIQLICSFEQKY